MPLCPNCGSYVSPGATVCSCGTTFGHISEPQEERKPTELDIQKEKKRKIRSEYNQRAKRLMDEGRYLEAAECYDRLLEMSQSELYKLGKAKAYYMAGMYDEALPLFRQSVMPFLGIDNYITYEWIGHTLNELNRFDEAIEAYEEAVCIVNDDYERRVKFHEENRWSAPSESYMKKLLDEKNERLSSLQNMIDKSSRLKERYSGSKPASDDESLREIGKADLVTIAGTHFYDCPEFKKGMMLKLKRERENEFDADAIAVYLDDAKVGYVANGDRTCCHLTSRASEVQLPDIAWAEYILLYAGRFHIARIER